MRLLRSSFLRSFALGFALAGGVLWMHIDGERDGVVPTAVAAPAQ